MKRYCVRQHDKKDCGAACVATVARDYGIKKSLAYFKNLTKTDINGTNIFGLVAALNQLGFKSDAYEASIIELSGVKRFPIIVRVISSENLYHFIVIDNIRNNKVYISDPEKGRYSLKISVFEKIYTGYLIQIEDTDKLDRTSSSSNTIIFFKELLKDNKQLIFFICLFSILVTIAGALFTSLIRYEFETLENKEQVEATGLPYDLEELHEIHEAGDLSEEEYISYYYIIDNVLWIQENFFIVVLFLVGIVFFQVIFFLVRQLLEIKLISKFENRIVSTVTDKMLSLNQNSVGRWNSGELLMRYDDAETVASSLISVCISLFVDVGMAIFGGIILFKESEILFYIVLMLVATYVVIALCFVNPIRNANLNELELATRQNSIIKEVIDSLFDIFVTSSKNYHGKRVRRITDEYVDKYKKARKIELSQRTRIMLSSNVCNVLLLIASFYLIINGYMMIATYITFISFMDYFISPIENIVNMQSVVQNGIISLQRLSDVLDDEDDTFEKSDDALSFEGDIEYKNITFGYGYRLPVLENFSCKIPFKKHTVIKGKNGCGKSSLVKLLNGACTFKEGDILFGGRSIKNTSIETLTKSVLYVPQKASLMSLSIKDNILMGLEEDLDRLKEIIEVVGLKQYIDDLPSGLDTLIEEDGRNLSTGQAQRLAIARALIRKPKVLILDEATSSIDREGTEKIYSNLITEYEGLTIISIMHDMNDNIRYDKMIEL